MLGRVTLACVSGKQRGRPRSTHAHQAILESARDLLAFGGYEQLTIEAIAARAGVGKQTVYRWWSSKASVVAEAVLGGYLVKVGEPPADTGDTAADLRAWLHERFGRLGDPAAVALVRGLTAAAADSDADAARLYEQLTGPSRRQLVARLATGVHKGQLRADADLEAAADALIGVLLYRVLARSVDNRARDDADSLIDVLFHGIAVDRHHD